MLKLEGIHVYYQESLAVSDVSISVKEGEFVTIIGANGAGKTTIMKAIMGLIRVKKGKIHFEGDDLTNKPPWVRAEMGIGYIPEGRRVFPDLSVVENLKVGAYTIKNKQILNQNLEKVFCLPGHLLIDPYEQKKCLNPSRCAIMMSDQWGTVSRSYRKDLQDTSGLRFLLNNHPHVIELIYTKLIIF